MLDQTALAELKLRVAGELIQPGDKDYEEARQVYNGMIERRPRLIVRCADVADVIAAVNFGRENRGFAGSIPTVCYIPIHSCRTCYGDITISRANAEVCREMHQIAPL